MAKVGHNFSPKDFSCWVKAETVAGTSTAGSGMYALNVDSVSYPSLNVSQALDVRSGGRFLRDDDFFQDNTLRQVELTLSGVLHNDAGHLALLRNICNDYSGDIAVATAYAAPPIIYGTAFSATTPTGTTGDTLTIMIKAGDLSHGTNLVFHGCVVTNYTISADTGTDSGRYKWSATLSTGFKPTLNDTTDFGQHYYGNDTDSFLSSSSAHKVFNTDVVMNNFTLTLDNPAIGIGSKSTGYEQMVRGTEFAVTVDTQVKLDGNTKGFVHTFDNQTSQATGAGASAGFQIVNNDAYGVLIDNGVITNVAYSEGDIMMLDCSLKAINDGSDPLVVIDVSA